MFWTDWGEEPKIERAEMDSSSRRVIIRQDIHWPNGLTIDYTTQKIYWTDAKLYYIAKANYDGSNRERIFKSHSQCVLGHPFALTLYDNKIYWTDWKTRGIHSTNKNTGQRCQRVWSDTYSPMDIHAYEPKRQKPRSGEFGQLFISVRLHIVMLSFEMLETLSSETVDIINVTLMLNRS